MTRENQLMMTDLLIPEITHASQRIGFMIDIETLGLRADAVVWQIGVLAFDLDDPETILWAENIFLPIQPQLDMGRKVSASTLIWWMSQDAAARNLFVHAEGDDTEELPALLRHISRKFNKLTQNGNLEYEVWARGPHFDIALLEHLYDGYGIEMPWAYHTIRCLRTEMKRANISSHDVARNPRYIAHTGLGDCYFQLDCLKAAWRNILRD